MCHYQSWTPLTPTLAQALATSLEMPCWYPISQAHSQLCLSVASALSSAHILAGGDQCSFLLAGVHLRRFSVWNNSAQHHQLPHKEHRSGRNAQEEPRGPFALETAQGAPRRQSAHRTSSEETHQGSDTLLKSGCSRTNQDALSVVADRVRSGNSHVLCLFDSHSIGQKRGRNPLCATCQTVLTFRRFYIRLLQDFHHNTSQMPLGRGDPQGEAL